MSIRLDESGGFEDLLGHLGHDIEVSSYGNSPHQAFRILANKHGHKLIGNPPKVNDWKMECDQCEPGQHCDACDDDGWVFAHLDMMYPDEYAELIKLMEVTIECNTCGEVLISFAPGGEDSEDVPTEENRVVHIKILYKGTHSVVNSCVCAFSEHGQLVTHRPFDGANPHTLKEALPEAISWCEEKGWRIASINDDPKVGSFLVRTFQAWSNLNADQD